MPAHYEIQITKKLSAQDIAYQFIAAFEGGSANWIEAARGVEDGGKEAVAGLWYDADFFAADGWTIELDHAGDDYFASETAYITEESIKQGLHTMQHKFERHFRDLIDEAGDAITADVFVQCCAFNDVIYG